MQDFVHLHVHTYYSILDGQSSIQKLVDKAIGDGMRGMAVTDHGDMFGIKEFSNYCASVNKKRKADGLEPFKPILGCEMYVAYHNKEDMSADNGDKERYHLIVLAKNKQGYKNLIKLVSRAWIDGFYFKPRTDHTDLEKYHEGLIVCSACIAGEVPKKIRKGDYEGALQTAAWYKSVFGDDYYLEVQRHKVTNPSIRANRDTYPEQVKANEGIMKIAKTLGIKVVCTNDVHFVDEDNAEAHDHLLCLNTGKDLDDPTRMLYTKQEWFKTRQEMNDVFADMPEVLSNTCEILDKVEIYSIDHAPIMPFFPIPENFGTEEELRKRITPEELVREFTTDENGENPMPEDEAKQKIEKLGGTDKLYRIKFEADYLARLAYDGAKKLYGDPVPDDVSERIKFELHIMKTMGFPGYFLIVQDFINTARDSLGVMVGPGRGSAAGSVVAYCLGITKIDPMKYDLLFERFLNPDRISLPDIDTDFDDDGRGKVLEWVEDKYGHDNCAHIITYGTMATKNAIKDVARVERVPLEEVNRLCKAIPDRLPNDDKGRPTKMTIPNAIKYVEALKEAEVSVDPKMRNTIKYAKMLEGTVRGTGIHACGFIICRDPISDWVPVSWAEDKSDKGHRLHCTQYDGHVIEETGLIKMDFLGLKTLSILKEAVENVKLTTGVDIDLDNIPKDDPLTYKLYQEGRTVATFQFESAGMRKYLQALHPTTFEDLIAMNALYRPGPMDYIPSFIDRKNGREPITYDIPCMEKYLKDTYGITVYQEQVMLLSRQLANFTRGQSDALRKAMGKKKKAIVDQMKPMFIEGGKKNGHDPKTLEKIWSDWEKFASYAFNKSHATCYSWVAFQTAYLKAHHPAEYMAAVMSRNLADIGEITKLMDECKKMGIKTLGPDINESRQKFGVNKRGEIRFGLAAVKGMGEMAAQALIEEREKNGPYKDVFDLVQRINLKTVNRKCIESLVMSGGMDSLGIKREQYYATNNKGEQFIDSLVRYGQRYQTLQMESQNSLFGMLDMTAIPVPNVPQAEEWSNIEKLNRERDLVGIYLSAHPLDDYAVIMKSMCNTRCGELEDKGTLTERGTLKIGGIVTGVKSKTTRTGKPCGFVSIEDYDSTGEIALFGEEWMKWQNMLMPGCAILIDAKMQPRRYDPSISDMRILNVQLLQSVNDSDLIKKFTININSDAISENMVDELSIMLNEAKGNTELHVRLIDRVNNYSVLLKSARSGISVKSELLAYIENNIDMSYQVN